MIGLAQIVLRRRLGMTYLAFILFYCFVVVPSYPVYLSLRSGEPYTAYFLAILLYEMTLALAVRVGPSVALAEPAPQVPLKWSALQVVVAAAIVVCTLYYIMLGMRSIGGISAWIRILLNPGLAVTFREIFWREIIPAIPMASLVRFAAKTGSTYLGLRLLDSRRAFLAVPVLALSLLSSALEATKSSLALWSIPLAVYLILGWRVKVSRLLPLLLVVAVGTLWLGALESHMNYREALVDKLLKRVFVTPSEVSMFHYRLFRGNHLWGATNGTIMALRGGSVAALGDESLDYDNYVMRRLSREIYGMDQTYGSANAPAFIYGFVDFGLAGVIVVGLITGAACLSLDDLLRRRTLSYAFISMCPLLLWIMLTSRNWLDSFVGPEGVGMLLGIELVIGARPAKSTLAGWLWVLTTISYYGLAYIVGTLS